MSIRYMGKFIEEPEAWKIMDELKVKCNKKKVYKFEYSFNRYNPQLGTSVRTSYVLACNESEAIRKAKKECDRYNSYGSLSFIGLTGDKKLLQNEVDYRWNIYLTNSWLEARKIVKELEEIYHS